MAKLIHNGKEILSDMRYLESVFSVSKGLMFSGKEKIEKGVCLVMPSKKDVKYGASVTMLFCFSSLEVLFVNSDFFIVDKVILKSWKPSYTPKGPCRYVIESNPGSFKDLNVGDKVEIEKDLISL